MAFKKIQAFGIPVEFKNPGESVQGVLKNISEGKTDYGQARFLQLENIDDETGEVTLHSVCISAALSHYNWEEMMDELIQIEYIGEEKSKTRKGKNFKKFEVYIDDGR